MQREKRLQAEVKKGCWSSGESDVEECPFGREEPGMTADGTGPRETRLARFAKPARLEERAREQAKSKASRRQAKPAAKMQYNCYRSGIAHPERGRRSLSRPTTRRRGGTRTPVIVGRW